MKPSWPMSLAALIWGGISYWEKGEIQSNGMDKNSLLANAMEAVIAAIYIDGGF